MTNNTLQPYTGEAISSENIEKNGVDANEGKGADAPMLMAEVAEERTDEKTFTQSEVEKLINERIKRERKVNSSLLPIKQLLRKMAADGVVEGESYSEMAEQFLGKLKESLSGVSDKASGTDKACGEPLAHDGAFEKDEGACQNENAVKAQEEKEGIESTKENTNVEKQEDTVTQQVQLSFSDIASLKQKYPDADINLLFDGGKFESFARGKSCSLKEIYDDYCAFLSLFSVPSNSASLGNEASAHNERAYVNSELASTAFSSMSGTSPVCDGLTKQQMEIARSAGLSYREYAELLSSIPKSGTRMTN